MELTASWIWLAGAVAAAGFVWLVARKPWENMRRSSSRLLLLMSHKSRNASPAWSFVPAVAPATRAV